MGQFIPSQQVHCVCRYSSVPSIRRSRTICICSALQVTGPVLPVYRLLNLAFRTCRMLRLKWVGLLSVGKQLQCVCFFLSMSLICGKEKNGSTSRQMFLLMVFAVRRGRLGLHFGASRSSSKYVCGCCIRSLVIVTINMPIEMAINAKGSFVWDRFSTVVVTCLLDPVRRISVFLFSNCETCSLQNLPEQLTVIHLSRRIQHELTPHSSRGHNVIPC